MFFTDISLVYYFSQRLQMADEETSDSDAANTVPATPVATKKRLAPRKVKTAKPKKPIQSDEGTISKSQLVQQVKQPTVI